MNDLVKHAREAAKDLRPHTWEEDGKSFFYPTVENHLRLAVADHLEQMADTIESLTAENARLRDCLGALPVEEIRNALDPEHEDGITTSVAPAQDAEILLRRILAVLEGKG